MPFGWFCVGYPEDFPVGEPKAIFYFDRHLVAWRDETGELHVQDPFCPHLGAHLGHGGTVEGCEIVCPFHGWKFDAEGVNTDIPYSERTNKKGTLRTFPVRRAQRRQPGLVPPRPRRSSRMWEIRELPEFNGDPEWSTVIRTAHTVDAPWQEMAENGVDSAHFRLRAQHRRGPGDGELRDAASPARRCAPARSSRRPAA